MGYISMDEVKTIIEFCPLIKCYGDPGTEKPFGKCSAFRNSGEEPIDVCKMCKACSTYEDDIDDDCLEDRDRDVHGSPLNKKGTYYSWVEGDSTSDLYQTEVRLVPMCSCGYVFTDGSCIEKYNDRLDNPDNKILYRQRTMFHPSVCPKCGRTIEQITMPGLIQTEDNELSPNRYKRVKHF